MTINDDFDEIHRRSVSDAYAELDATFERNALSPEPNGCQYLDPSTYREASDRMADLLGWLDLIDPQVEEQDS